MEIPPGEESSIYRKEIQQGLQIFEKSFKGYQETRKFPEKKMEFQKAMAESLQAIQDACSALMNKELVEKKDKLSKDYQEFLNHPTSQNANQIEKDVNSMRESSS
jgi:hypothetical protein